MNVVLGLKAILSVWNLWIDMSLALNWLFLEPVLQWGKERRQMHSISTFYGEIPNA